MDQASEHLPLSWQQQQASEEGCQKPDRPGMWRAGPCVSPSRWPSAKRLLSAQGSAGSQEQRGHPRRVQRSPETTGFAIRGAGGRGALVTPRLRFSCEGGERRRGARSVGTATARCHVPSASWGVSKTGSVGRRAGGCSLIPSFLCQEHSPALPCRRSRSPHSRGTKRRGNGVSNPAWRGARDDRPRKMGT